MVEYFDDNDIYGESTISSDNGNHGPARLEILRCIADISVDHIKNDNNGNNAVDNDDYSYNCSDDEGEGEGESESESEGENKDESIHKKNRAIQKGVNNWLDKMLKMRIHTDTQ